MAMETNMVGWFEIPVTDMARARSFYERVFGIEIQVHRMNQLEMGWFPSAQGKPGAAGSLVKHEGFYYPDREKGPVLYFSCTDLQEQLDRIPGAGGEILQPKKLIAEGMGYMALFADTEGNRLALYSQK